MEETVKSNNSIILNSDPSIYDYLHIIALKKDGTCNLTDGGGQSINFDADYKYKMTSDSLTILNFDTGEEISNIHYTLEEGIFVLAGSGIVWFSSAADWPVYICRKRYIFSVDPIRICQEPKLQSKGNLWCAMNAGVQSKENIYYADIIDSSVKELSKDELQMLKKQNPNLYVAFLHEKEEFEKYALENECDITFDPTTGEDILLCKGVSLTYSEWLRLHPVKRKK